MIYAISILTLICVVQLWLLWRLIRAMGRLQGFEDQLARCTQGLSLLVDTSEAGFAILGSEIVKLAAAPARPPSVRATSRRVAAAASHGAEIPDIAAQQGLSEGEVRLRIHLAAAEAASSRDRDGVKGDGVARGTVRT